MKTSRKTFLPITRFTLDFLRTEAGSGFVLAAAALIACVWANSPWAETYLSFIHYHFPIQIGGWRFEESVLEWTKEGLMAIFFFVVGLEIKYEVVRGALSSPQKLALPVIAALGGMVVPALVYVGINLFGGDLRGWSVPTATDIAFALAVLAFAGKNLPTSLRVFLLTLAIVDDLGAVVIIGVFYNSQFDPLYVGIVMALLGGMFALKYLFRPLSQMGFGLLYALFFIAIWAMSLKAGLSPSLTAVAAAFCVSVDGNRPGQEGLLKTLTHELHPYVAYVILPFFAFTASGFSLAGVGWATLIDPRLLGVVLGLFVGKQVGVYLAATLAIRAGWARLPEGASHLQLYGVCLLCGIGFTMSLFMTALAFPADDLSAQICVKSGVVLASILSACAGAAILRKATPGDKSA